VQHIKTGKESTKSQLGIPSDHKIYQCSKSVPNGHKIQQDFPLQCLPKHSKTTIFGMKIYHHLETLLSISNVASPTLKYAEHVFFASFRLLRHRLNEKNGRAQLSSATIKTDNLRLQRDYFGK
jgi:hypothetical protein